MFSFEIIGLILLTSIFHQAQP